MSSHRVTEKPHLPRPLTRTGAADPPTAESNAPSGEPGAKPPLTPRQPYPGSDSRHGGRGRRHWISIFSMLLAVANGVSATPHEQGLAFRDEAGWTPALALDTAIEMNIRGLVAEVVVRQRYVNDSPQWQEGRYLLPLPADAAVGHLRVHIGERIIEGEVRERAAARQAYVQAAQQGRSAALVEQQRPNLFRTGLTNIGPGEAIEVEIGYWQAVSYRDETFSLSLPLTLTPRFTPAAADPALLDPADPLPVNGTPASPGIEPTVSLRADLQAGVPLLGIDSPSHRISVRPMAGFQRIELADLVELADRDFELRWRPMPSTLPQRAVFTEEVDGEHYALLLLLPPTLPGKPLPREMILVVDTSGSMQGTAMQQAIAALDSALLRLGPDDRFNVIQFNSVSERLFPESMPLTPGHLARARRYVAGLQASGGTVMAPAIGMAFEGEPPPGLVRQVVLATDAAIDNEAELFALIEARRGSARLFPVGIGSAPNGHFIRKAAELGRGSQVLIRDVGEVAERMQGLFARLDRPMLHDLEVHWPDASDVYPPQVPDLYHGEPLQILARLPVLQGELGILGQTRDQPWRTKLRLDPLHVVSAAGVGRLWGRARIEAVEDAMRAGLGETEGRALIVETALQHGLASRYTSLVAIERTPSRPADAALGSSEIANAAPADSLAMAQGSTAARSKLGLALTLLLMAAAVFRRREPCPEPGMA